MAHVITKTHTSYALESQEIWSWRDRKVTYLKNNWGSSKIIRFAKDSLLYEIFDTILFTWSSWFKVLCHASQAHVLYPGGYTTQSKGRKWVLDVTHYTPWIAINYPAGKLSSFIFSFPILLRTAELTVHIALSVGLSAILPVNVQYRQKIIKEQKMHYRVSSLSTVLKYTAFSQTSFCKIWKLFPIFPVGSFKVNINWPTEIPLSTHFRSRCSAQTVFFKTFLRELVATL